MARIIVCDDEQLIRWSLSEHLTSMGYSVDCAVNGRECLDMVLESPPAAVVMDLKMPEMDGLTCLRKIREADVEVPVIVITAHGQVESAIEATHLGASGWLSKPFDLDEVGLTVQRVVDQAALARTVTETSGAPATGYAGLIGASAPMERVFDLLRKLESVDAPTVLISGESGTGKDLVAQAIHSRGPRRAGPYMEVDCASLPEQLIESELFGHERGSFTDAKQLKRGQFEVARGGTIFLDEIGEMSLPTQAKLLRALESRRFKRVGGVQSLPLDAALVAATNRDLRQEVREGRFREDLYFRLAVIPIAIPPLRHRSEDIALLVAHLLKGFAATMKRPLVGIEPDALQRLSNYGWPGNVRELRNVLERCFILNAEDGWIRSENLPGEIRFGTQASDVGAGLFALPEEGIALDLVERSFLVQALERTDWNQSAAARLLGITRYTLRYRMDKFEIQPS